MKLRLMVLASTIASFVLSTNLGAFLWWGEKEKPTLENTIQDLQKKQADSPNDPYINYNLGVALYKAGKFNQAGTNFDRASIAAVDQELKKRCFFNLGSLFYKEALTTLPENWETTDVPPEKLEAAIAKTQLALKKYDSVLLLDKHHEQAKANKKVAQELLEKLEKKKQKQEKDKKEQKKDQDKREQNQDKQENGEKKPAQKKEEPQQKQAQQGTEQKQESMEQRGVRALLDNLQHDESKLQKALISKKLKDEGKPQDSSQRPW